MEDEMEKFGKFYRELLKKAEETERLIHEGGGTDNPGKLFDSMRTYFHDSVTKARFLEARVRDHLERNPHAVPNVQETLEKISQVKKISQKSYMYITLGQERGIIPTNLQLSRGIRHQMFEPDDECSDYLTSLEGLFRETMVDEISKVRNIYLKRIVAAKKRKVLEGKRAELYDAYGQFLCDSIQALARERVQLLGVTVKDRDQERALERFDSAIRVYSSEYEKWDEAQRSGKKSTKLPRNYVCPEDKAENGEVED